jgi:hypothetical protein
LPQAIQTHGLSIGWAASVGDFHVDVAPGYAYDTVFGLGAPMVFGALAWEPHPDVAFSLTGGWGGRSFTVGSPETYHLLRLNGHWWF